MLPSRFGAALAMIVLFAARSAHAGEIEPRVIVHVAPDVPKAEAGRIASAIRGQLQGIATVDSGSDVSTGATCIVDVRADESGLTLHFADGEGHAGGPTRTVGNRGEIGASEVGTIVRA